MHIHKWKNYKNIYNDNIKYQICQKCGIVRELKYHYAGVTISIDPYLCRSNSWVQTDENLGNIFKIMWDAYKKCI